MFLVDKFYSKLIQEERCMASVQLEFFRTQKVSRAVDLQISTPRCASHGCNSLERALANQLAACKKMQKDAKRIKKIRRSKRVKENSAYFVRYLCLGSHALTISIHILHYFTLHRFVQFIFLKRVNFERLKH
jgi:hypothetical protein